MKRAHRQAGVISVELAIIMIFVFFMLGPITLIGRLLWYYSVAKSATLESARMLATAPAYTFQVASTRNAWLAAAIDTAYAKARTNGIPESAIASPAATTSCDDMQCSVSAVPRRVKVAMVLTVMDNLFPNVTGNLIPESGFVIGVETELPHSGAAPMNATGAP